MKRHLHLTLVGLLLLGTSVLESKAETIKIYSETAELIDHTSYMGGTYGWWQLRENSSAAEIYYSFGTVYGTTRVTGDFTLSHMDAGHDEWGWTYLYNYTTKKRLYFNKLVLTGYAYNNGYHYVGTGICTDGNTYEFDIYTEGTENPGGHKVEEEVSKTTLDGFLLWVNGDCTCYKMNEAPRIANEGGFTNVYVGGKKVLSLPIEEGAKLYVTFGDYNYVTPVNSIPTMTPVRRSGKYIMGGRLVIIKDGKQYDISGREIK